LIDELKIYDRALTQEEILLDYNSFLEAKFVDENIVDAGESVDWDKLKINSELNYDFGNELSSNNDLFNENLVGLWHLNGDATDSSGNGFDGINNGANLNASGLWGTNAGEFNGSSYIDVTGVTTDSSWTLSVWLNPVDVSGSPKVFDCESGRLVFEYAAGYWRVWDGTARNSLISDGLLDVWSHWVVAQNGTSLYFYKNGVFINSITSVGNFFGGTCVIGARYSKDSTFFDGKIEEVAIWDRVLTQEEISELYNNSIKQIELELYSCSDLNCENKTSTQTISNAKNNYWHDISLSDAQYFGWSAYLKPIDEFIYLGNGYFSTSAFIQDINISIIE
jgi:hypothetical protein